MKKLIALIILLLASSMVTADKAIVGYYQQGAPYYDYVIVYTYTRSDGTIGLSHCRTRSSKNLQYAFAQQSVLDLNDCDLSYNPNNINAASPDVPQATMIGNPQTTSGFSTEKAF